MGANGGGAGVGACHGHGAVGDAGILLGGVKTVGSRPTVGGPFLCVYSQCDNIANTVRTSVANHGRNNAAIGFTRTTVFGLLESDAGGSPLFVLGDYHDIILPNLRCVGYLTGLCR